jgi:repressor LexA
VGAAQDRQGSLSLLGHWRGDLFASQIRGSSMQERGILDGDYVIVQNQSDAESGEIVVAMIDKEATVKVLEKSKGRVRLLPANPNFYPIELREDRENKITGRVVSVQRFY